MRDTIAVHPTGALTNDSSVRARDYMGASKSDNTKRAYKTAWSEFVAFCERGGKSTEDVGAVVDYLTALADRGQRVSTIRVKLAAIAFAYRTRGLTSPTDSEAVRILMQGIARKLKSAANQKAPVLRRLGEDSRPSAVEPQRDA